MRSISLILIAIAFAGCTGGFDITDPTGTGVMPLPDAQKGDNYISTNAREYELTGYAHAVLPEGFEALEAEQQAAEVERVIASRMSRVVQACKSHINTTIQPFNGSESGENAPWFIYVKRGAGEATKSELLTDGRVRFAFGLELVGSYYLMSKVAPEDGSTRTFSVTVAEWSGEQSEDVQVTIKGSESRDAFPKYNELFQDGVFDIAIHFGGDYNEGRHDLETAKWTVETLLGSGFSHSSVTGFDNLTIDSGPFTRTLTVEGQAVEVRVKVVHSDMVEAADEEKLATSMKDSMANYDVIFYSGHAGAGAGFILDYQPKFEIKAAEFETLDLPQKYQIFVFDGCRTYRTYVDDMMKNPAKNWDNTDIITTVNTTPFGAGYYVIWEFVNWFTLTDNDGNHFPLSWKTILRGVNKPAFKSVHYGVHGIDNNPKLNPHKSEGVACTPCTSDDQCGAGGNLCLGYSAGSACGVACTTDTACPDGYRCARLNDDPDLFYLPKQCVRRDYICPANGLQN